MMRVLLVLLLVVGLVACGGDERVADRAPSEVLTVADAIEQQSDTPLTVRGFLLIEGGQARLCEAILESYPPQCGRPALLVERLDPTLLQLEEGPDGAVRWAEGVTLFGLVAGDRLLVSQIVAGAD